MGVFRYFKAVGSAFIGLRKKKEMEKDFESLSFVHLVCFAIIFCIAFIFSLLIIIFLIVH